MLSPYALDLGYALHEPHPLVDYFTTPNCRHHQEHLKGTAACTYQVLGEEAWRASDAYLSMSHAARIDSSVVNQTCSMHTQKP